MKTQTIKRSDLSTIYDSVCEDWKKIIDKLLKVQKFNLNIKVQEDLIQKAFDEASKTQKTLLNKYFDLPKNIMDEIKTLNDVYINLGIKRNDIIPFKNPKNKLQKSANAFIDIQHISKCLNQDDKFPDFKDSNQYKYYPWFKRGSLYGWVLCCSAFDFDGTALGFGCFYKSEKLSDYAANTFLSVYKDYLP